MSTKHQKGWYLELCLLFVVSLSILSTINYLYSEIDKDSVYIGISSNSLMQTLPAYLLEQKPLSSLYFNHTSPPLFDAMRALIATFWNADYAPLPQFIDKGLYGLHTVLFGILSVLIFVWIAKATGSRIASWLGALIWILHPGPISMYSFLDPTFITSVFITWLVFELWLLYKGEGAVSRLILVAVLCFLTKAHFQWFFVPVLATCMVLLGVDRKRLIIGLAALSFVVILYCAKQFILFGTVHSYGFFGENLTGSLWIENIGDYDKDYKANCGASSSTSNKADCEKFLSRYYPSDILQIGMTYPEGAKLLSGGGNNYNTEQYWWLSHVHTRIAKEQCAKHTRYCINSLIRSFRQNFPEYWVESWDRRNPVVSDENGIPWTNLYFKIAHNYPWLIFASFLVLTITLVSRWPQTNLMPIIGLSIIPLYVFTITLTGNIYDAFEGVRLKFLLEPVIFTFIFVQGVLSVRFIYLGSRGRQKDCREKRGEEVIPRQN